MTYNFKQKVSDGGGSDMSKRWRLVSWEMFRALCPVNFLYKAPSFNLGSLVQNYINYITSQK